LRVTSIVQALHGKDVSTSTLFLRLIHRVVALFQTVFATRYLSRNGRFLINRVSICVKVFRHILLYTTANEI
jgi:hypothetical protein